MGNMLSQRNTSCVGDKRPREGDNGRVRSQTKKARVASQEEMTTQQSLAQVLSVVTDMQIKMHSMQSQINDIHDKIATTETEQLLVSLLEEKSTRLEGKIDSIISTQTIGVEETDLSTINSLEERSKRLERKIDGIISTQSRIDDTCLGLESSTWKFTAPTIPFSYWISKGHNRDYATEMTKFLVDFERIVHEIRAGRPNRVEISTPARVMSTHPRIILQHHDILMPYWKELSKALYNSSNSLHCLPQETHTSFHLWDMQISNQVLSILSPVLELNHFKTMCFRENSFGRDGFMILIEIIRKNPELKTLVYVNNPIESDDDAKCLVDIINKHPSIEHIDLQASVGTLHFGTICSIIACKKKFDVIDLSENNITTLGSNFIQDFLSTNPCLNALTLSRNNFNDDDAILFAHALKSNTTLQRIDLAGNNITILGQRALINAIFNPATLNSVSDSNHSCVIVFETETSSSSDACKGFDVFHVNRRNVHANTRMLKMFVLLSCPNEDYVNLHHLAGIPLEFVPNVLGLIRHYPGKVQWCLMEKLLKDLRGGCDNIPRMADLGSLSPRDWELVGFRDDEEEEKCVEIKSLNVMFQVFRDWAVPALASNIGYPTLMRY